MEPCSIAGKCSERGSETVQYSTRRCIVGRRSGLTALVVDECQSVDMVYYEVECYSFIVIAARRILAYCYSLGMYCLPAIKLGQILVR